MASEFSLSCHGQCAPTTRSERSASPPRALTGVIALLCVWSDGWQSAFFHGEVAPSLCCCTLCSAVRAAAPYTQYASPALSTPLPRRSGCPRRYFHAPILKHGPTALERCRAPTASVAAGTAMLTVCSSDTRRSPCSTSARAYRCHCAALCVV